MFEKTWRCVNNDNNLWVNYPFKGIVHFEIKIWYLSAYPGHPRCRCLLFSVDPILMFLGQTVLVCQSYNGSIGHCLYKREKEHAQRIKIKQFPIVTTHWWPKTRNERFVWENEQYLYRFLPLVHNHVQVIWVRTHPVCDVCVCARSGSSASTLDGGRVWSVVLTRRHSYNNQSHTSLVLHELDWVFAWGDLIGWCLRWRLKSCVSTMI